METYKIENEEGRLDKVVSTIQKNISRMTIQKMIENGDILVNDDIKKSIITLLKAQQNQNKRG